MKRIPLLAVSFSALLLAACGGPSASMSIFDEPIDGADASSTGDTSAAPPDGVVVDDTDPGPNPGDGGNPKKDTGVVVEEDTATPPPPLSLDNVCSRLADAVCAAPFSTCCTTKGFAFKESGCKAAILAGCSDQVDAIKDGDGTFNASAFEPCVNAWKTLSTKCSVPLLEYIKTYPACNQLLNGSTPPGDSCGEDWECKVGAGAYANCSSGGRCESVTIVGKDQPCVYSGSTRSICDYGLYCQFTSSAGGTCRAAKPLGGACSESYECDFGNWCERSAFGGAGKCVVGRGYNEPCNFGGMCASGSCVSNRCTDPNVTPASPAICSGTTG